MLRCGKNRIFKKIRVNGYAQTLDGKTATACGHSQWITGKAARQRVQHLRKRADAVMAGVETFRKDSPRFTVRSASGKVLKTPRRIIVTHHPEQYEKAGFEFVNLPSPEDWNRYLLELGRQGVTALLLEGGGSLAASALKARAVNRVEFHTAPKLLGGVHSRTSLDGPDPLTLEEAVFLEEVEVRFPLQIVTVAKRRITYFFQFRVLSQIN